MCFKFRGIIFDMDGTLTVPKINFKELRKRLNIPENKDILEYAETLSSNSKKEYFEIIESFELEGLKKMEFQKNVEKTLSDFEKNNIKLAIITRNSKQNSEVVLRKLNIDFSPILTREFSHIKPDPTPVNYIVKEWQLDKNEVLIVGDFKDDILSGNNAGISTCFFQNEGYDSYSEIADYTVSNYNELKELIYKTK